MSAHKAIPPPRCGRTLRGKKEGEKTKKTTKFMKRKKGREKKGNREVFLHRGESGDAAISDEGERGRRSCIAFL